MVFLAFSMLILAILLLPGMFAWVVRPLDSAAKLRQRPTQFTIVDFLCLFVLVQVPTALLHYHLGTQESGHRILYLLDPYAWLTVGTIWFKCVQIMSRAGIQQTWRRATLLLFVLPATLLSMFGCIAVIVGILSGVCDRGFGKGAFLLMVLSIVLPLNIWFCAFLVRRILAASELSPEAPQSGDSPPEET
jgi:hypothetical protein